MHFGSLVAAMASFLAARRNLGLWLVRIEDLDPPREVAGAASDILRTLEAFGFEWDGPVAYQSQRSAAYDEAIERLASAGLSYPCSCSRRDIRTAGKAGTRHSIYPGTCRTRGPLPGRELAIRVKIDARSIDYVDRLQGPQSADLARDAGDFVIRRRDGLYAYQLAVVVDDHHQAITEVVRGVDLLDSTPRQIYLQSLLGFRQPDYLHVPIVVDADGRKLSTQTGATPIEAAHPQRGLIDALAFLMLDPPQALESASVAEVWGWAVEHWNVDRLAGRRTGGMPGVLRN